MISLILNENSFAAGSSIAGRFTYSPAAQASPTAAQVNLLWRTEGRGTRDRQIIQSLPTDLAQLTAGVAVPFILALPAGGPITYNGLLLRIIWEVQIVVTLAGLLPKRDQLDQAIQVVCR